MLNNLLKRFLVFGIVIIFLSVNLTTYSYSSSVRESRLSTDNDNILKYTTARLSWNPGEVDTRLLSETYGEGYGIAGPFEYLDYEFGWEINSSYLILNGTLNVKPLTGSKLTLNPGDKLSIMFSFGFAITVPEFME